METILIMARALEKANTNLRIDVLHIHYNTDKDEYIGYLTLTLVEGCVWNRTIQSKYVIKTDGTIVLDE